MCGIVGYVGDQACSEVLLSGLSRLEYRGYDSAGIAIGTEQGDVRIQRAQGKLASLFSAFHQEPFDGCIGLGHTRWATHGRPVERNAHPHRAGQVVVAHNGIIENYGELKRELLELGRRFESETDTEVIAHLIDHTLGDGAEADLHSAVRRALGRVRGSYALVVMLSRDPKELVVARNASPMVIGRQGDEIFAASDVPAVLPYTRDFMYLQDGDTAVLTPGQIQVFDQDNQPVTRDIKRINWDPISAEKQGYKHFMLKEIHEQPERITDTLRSRVSLERGDVDFGDIGLDEEWVAQIKRVVFVACGTSFYSAQVTKYAIEHFARVPVDVELASEFRYRDPIIDEYTLCIPVSQSGETADTLAAMRLAKELGAKTVAVCNVVESTMTREADGTIYTQAGPEIGVASTKAFSTQLAVGIMMAVWLGRKRGAMDQAKGREILEALRDVPQIMSKMLHEKAIYKHIAYNFSDVNSFLYLGRGNLFPIAAEGALKLKEISYIHAEGYAAGEMKHGPIALIDEHLPVVVLAPKNRVYEKVFSALEEVKARQGRLIVLATEGDNNVREVADVVLEIPEVPEFVQPLLSVVVMQLLAYHIADFKGTDVDQPRNLAKSVTVE